MHNPPTDEELARLPDLFSSLDVPREDLSIHFRFFHSRGEWYAAEYSPQGRTFFGYSIHRGAAATGAWGLFGLDELVKYRGERGDEIERDTSWKPVRARDVPAIGRGDFSGGD